MGDVGWLDDEGRFWYCGRKSHRVETADGPLFTECVEAVFNAHPAVRRSALVGVGAPGLQRPTLVVEHAPTYPGENWKQELLRLAESRADTQPVTVVLEHPCLPVDVRHNAKINREQLTAWATARLKGPV
jgi:acyl-coenzyme A synthetase/AMP-(fatty) acid ligase